MNYHNITTDDMLNGDGLRTVLWVSGCSLRCKNCHNSQTHDFNSGIPFDDNAMTELLEELNKPYISGLTLSGGHPLEPQNADEILKIVKRVKMVFPHKNIWIYSGYIWEDIITNPKLAEIMKYCDILVDGKYIDKLRDVTLAFRGSSNQRIINIQKSIAANKVVLWEEI